MRDEDSFLDFDGNTGLDRFDFKTELLRARLLRADLQ
jgi:hypothetical protein